MKHVHKLVYNRSSKRWHAYNEGNYCSPIFCGDPICIRVKDRYFQARIEKDTAWYVLIEGIKFRLHPKQKYDAILLF
jgi:hypothetical protein